MFSPRIHSVPKTMTVKCRSLSRRVRQKIRAKNSNISRLRLVEIGDRVGRVDGSIAQNNHNTTAPPPPPCYERVPLPPQAVSNPIADPTDPVSVGGTVSSSGRPLVLTETLAHTAERLTTM